MQKKLKLLLASNLLVGNVLAGGLSALTGNTSTTVLPQGIRNFTYKGVYGAANDRFNGAGQVKGVGDGFNSVVTFKDLVENEETANDQASAEAKVKGLAGVLGYTPESIMGQAIGETRGTVNVEVNAHVPVFAYGITKNWTTAIVVPVVQRKYSVDVGSKANGLFQEAANEFTKDGQATANKGAEIKEKFENAIVNKLEDNGYEPLSNGNFTDLGDIQIRNKIQLSREKYVGLAMEAAVTLPTGKQANVNKKVDIGSGDRQTDVSLGFNSDFFVTSDITLSSGVFYTAQLSDHLATRVPEEVDSTVSPDIDYDTRRNLGDIMGVQAGASYQIMTTVTLSAGYAFQYKEKDEYYGNKVQSFRYKWLAENSRQNMQSANVGIAFSTVPLFRQKKFALPMEAAIGYATVLSGKNVVKDPVTTFDLRVFF